jgi:protein-tyrosine phosphatase
MSLVHEQAVRVTGSILSTIDFRVIDLHCHILPGVDDGPESVDESLAMAGRAAEDGIRTIVATPHTLNGMYTNPIKEIVERVAALREALSKNHIELMLYPGADVRLCPCMMDLIQSGQAGTINNAGKYVMIELPSEAIPFGVRDEIFSMKLNGITPIISHPERNSAIQHDIGILYALIRMGALSQITAMSVVGDFGGAAMRCAETLLVRRLAHVIASDAHSATWRPPVLSTAVEAAAEIMGAYEDAERMVTEIPSAILSGGIPEVPEPGRVVD